MEAAADTMEAVGMEEDIMVEAAIMEAEDMGIMEEDMGIITVVGITGDNQIGIIIITTVVG